MAKASEVLNYLLPNGGWTIEGDNFSSIVYDNGVRPVTKDAFEGGFAIVDELNAEKATNDAATKAAILERLGITEEEARIILR